MLPAAAPRTIPAPGLVTPPPSYPPPRRHSEGAGQLAAVQCKLQSTQNIRAWSWAGGRETLKTMIICRYLVAVSSFLHLIFSMQKLTSILLAFLKSWCGKYKHNKKKCVIIFNCPWSWGSVVARQNSIERWNIRVKHKWWLSRFSPVLTSTHLNQ